MRASLSFKETSSQLLDLIPTLADMVGKMRKTRCDRSYEAMYDTTYVDMTGRA